MFREGDLVRIGPDYENGLFIIIGGTIDTLAGKLWLCCPLDIPTYREYGAIEMSENWLRLESSID